MRLTLLNSVFLPLLHCLSLSIMSVSFLYTQPETRKQVFYVSFQLRIKGLDNPL